MKITDYLAIYAAILSTSVFIWNILNSKPRFKVDLSFSIDTINGVTLTGLSIIVRNISPHNIHLANIGVVYPYSKSNIKDKLKHFWRFKQWPRRIGWCHTDLILYSIKDNCPICLEARNSHHVFIPMDIVDQILSEAYQKTIIAFVQDQLWNNVYSKPFKWISKKKV